MLGKEWKTSHISENIAKKAMPNWGGDRYFNILLFRTPLELAIAPGQRVNWTQLPDYLVKLTGE